jgi:hypothetical protein
MTYSKCSSLQEADLLEVVAEVATLVEVDTSLASVGVVEEVSDDRFLCVP